MPEISRRDQDPGALIKAVIQWIERSGEQEPVPGGIAWLAPVSSSEGDQQVRELRPKYMRALERIGVTI